MPWATVLILLSLPLALAADPGSPERGVLGGRGLAPTAPNSPDALCTDADGDGYYVDDGHCTPPAGKLPGDCKDNNAAIHPGAVESCNDLDDDCNGLVDDSNGVEFGLQRYYYADDDGDTFGNAAVSTRRCEQPPGYVINSLDCDDTNAAINPNALEVCGDGKDNNCDGITDGAGGTRYVSTTGSDANDCTSAARACATIQRAVDASCGGETILVGPGSFAGATIGKSVALHGNQFGVTLPRGGAETQVSGGTDAVFVVTSSNVTIDGFDISGGGAYAGVMAFANADYSNVVVSHNRIHDITAGNPNSGAHVSLGVMVGSGSPGDRKNVSGIVVANNSFAAIGASGTNPGRGVFAYTIQGGSPGAGIDIHGNTFSDIREGGTGAHGAAIGIDIGKDFVSPPAPPLPCTGVSITGNTYQNVFAGAGLFATSSVFNEPLASFTNVPLFALTTFPIVNEAALSKYAKTDKPTGFPGSVAYLSTIQGAVSASDPAATVSVTAGTWPEHVTVDAAKTGMALIGPNAGVAGNGVRTAEAVITAVASEPRWGVPTCTFLMSVLASNVTVKGFTFDGDNPALAGGMPMNGANADVCVGLINEADNSAPQVAVSSALVQNNIFRNIAGAAVLFDNAGTSTTGTVIDHNAFDNMDPKAEIDGYGIGVYLGSNHYAQVTNNQFRAVRKGVQFENFYAAKPAGPAALISGNDVESTRAGIWYNLHYSDAASWEVTGNTLAASALAPAANRGLWLTSLQSAVAINVHHNTATGGYAGVDGWNITSTGALTVDHITVTSAEYGAVVDNSSYAPTSGAATLTVTNLTATGCTTAGAAAFDDPAGGATGAVTLHVVDSTLSGPVEKGTSSGVLATGQNASISAVRTTVTGAKYGVHLADAGNALVSGNQIFGNDVGVQNDTGNTADASCVWWGSAAGPGAGGNNDVVQNTGVVTTSPFDIDTTFGNTHTFYADADVDGYGNVAVQIASCGLPAGYVTNSADCNDADNTVFPGAAELCDGQRNDCTNLAWLASTEADADGDGYRVCASDCNDASASVHPGAVETIANGIDENCDGFELCYVDTDGDHYGTAATVSSANLACNSAGLASVSGDCDDTRASVHPLATEICNLIDDDCNGTIDEGVKTTFYADADADGYGNVAATQEACSPPAGYVSNHEDCDDAKSSVYPGAPLVCDGVLDHDCNGVTDVQPPVRFVATDGSDTVANAFGKLTANDCAAGRPCLTIQHGIDVACAGQAVSVAAGAYVENVVATKPIAIGGAGQTDTTIYPAVSAPACSGGSLCAGASNVILVQASNVSIHDLAIDGDNPALTSGKVFGGADIDARNGIIENFNAGVFSGTTVNHVTVRNIYLRGIYLSSGGDAFSVTNSTVSNVKADAGSIALFNFGGAGTFADNHVDGANDAIAANWSRGTQFLRNVITNSGSGLHTDNSSGTVADTLQDNQVSDCSTGGYGVWAFVPRGAAPVVSNNTVTKCDVGLALFGGTSTTPATVFSGNTVSGSAACTVGAMATTWGVGYGPFPARATFTGNTITGCTYGLDAWEDDVRTESLTLVANHNTIQSNGTGVWIESSLDSGSVDISGNDIFDNTAAGVTNDAAISVAASCTWWGGSALSPAVGPFPGNNTLAGTHPELVGFNRPRAAQAFDYTSTYFPDGDADGYGTGTGVSACGPLVNVANGRPTDAAVGGDCNDTVAAINPAAFEACDGIDNNCSGTTDEFTGPRFVATTGSDGANACTSSGSPCLTLTHAIAAACAGETINAGAGNFVEDVTINKPGLSIVGAGIDQTFITGKKNDGNKNAVYFVSNGATLSDVTVTREGNTVAEWTQDLDDQGVSFQGVTSGTLQNCKITHNRNGVYVNNAQGVTVRNCLIVENRTGMQFANGIQNCNVRNNVIQNNTTLGILFNFGIDATGATFFGNNVSDNWYGQIEARGIVPGTFENVSGNWLGSAVPTVVPTNSGEPGYASQIPYWAGGTSTPPAILPNGRIGGVGAATVDFTPWLNSGADTDVALGFQGDFSYLNVDDDSPQAGTVGRISEGVALATAGGTVSVKAGTYAEDNVNVTKSLTLQGAGKTSTIIDASASLNLGNVVDLNVATPSSTVTFDGFQVRNGKKLQGVAFHSVGATGSTITISNNKLVGFGPGNDPAYDFGVIGGYQGVAKVVVTNNEISGTTNNAVLFERHRGESSVDHNTITMSADQTAAVYFMTYNGLDVTTPQRVADNTITLSATPGSGSNAVVFTIFSGGVTPSGKYTDVKVTGNTVTGLLKRTAIGIYEESPDGSATITSPEISGNTITGAAGSTGRGIGIYDNVTGAKIESNKVSGVATGIALTQFWSSAMPSTASIQFNDVTANGTGISTIGGTAGAAHGNLISGNTTTGVANSGSGAFDATCNFWGTSGGPNTSGADTTSGTVTTTTWLLANDHNTDLDGDGYTSCNQYGGFGDCNVSVAAIHPGATETCNGLDDNCNLAIDEGGDVALCDSTFCAPMHCNGSCVAQTVPDCNDGTNCTTDTCDNGLAQCVHTSSGTCDVVGTVRYYRAGATEPGTQPVEGVTVDLTGSPMTTTNSVTNALGQYSFPDAFGNTTFTPRALAATETECRNSITGGDASAIAKAAVGLVTLTPNQVTAADVSDNARVSSFDASLVAQKSVATVCTSYVFPVAASHGSDWAFAPVSKSFAPLLGTENYDFLAVLYGDVTGNWDSHSVAPSAPEAPAFVARGTGNITTFAAPANGGGATIYLAGGPRAIGNDEFEVTLGLMNADGILGLDLAVVHDANVTIKNVRTVGLASSFTLEQNSTDDGYRTALFSPLPMAGTGEFLVVTVEFNGPVSGLPFEVSAEANEGQIPLTWAPGLPGHAPGQAQGRIDVNRQ